MIDQYKEHNFINSVHSDGTIDFHQFRKNFNVRNYHPKEDNHKKNNDK